MLREGTEGDQNWLILETTIRHEDLLLPVGVYQAQYAMSKEQK